MSLFLISAYGVFLEAFLCFQHLSILFALFFPYLYRSFQLIHMFNNSFYQFVNNIAFNLSDLADGRIIPLKQFGEITFNPPMPCNHFFQIQLVKLFVLMTNEECLVEPQKVQLYSFHLQEKTSSNASPVSLGSFLKFWFLTLWAYGFKECFIYMLQKAGRSSKNKQNFSN